MSATTGLPRKVLLRVKEVAVYFNVTERTIYTWLDLQILDGRKIGGSRFVTRESIQAALNSSTDVGLTIL